jgi:GDP-D-mannose dehydratase
VIRNISDIVGFAPTVILDPKKVRRKDNQIIIGDNSKMTSELNWHPTISLAKSLRDSIEFFAAQKLVDVTHSPF